MKVERFELGGLPRAGVQHFLGQVGGAFLTLGSIRGTPGHAVGFDGLDVDQFAALQILGRLCRESKIEKVRKLYSEMQG